MNHQSFHFPCGGGGRGQPGGGGGGGGGQPEGGGGGGGGQPEGGGGKGPPDGGGGQPGGGGGGGGGHPGGGGGGGGGHQLDDEGSCRPGFAETQTAAKPIKRSSFMAMIFPKINFNFETTFNFSKAIRVLWNYS